MLVFIILCWIISFHPSPADADHLFFLHNRYLESNDLNRPHDVYGKMEYNEIITAFKANGFEVHNEIRPTNTDPKVYAQKIKLEIENLISSGVSPDHITVVGTSKGGYIAQYVSTYLANPEVNFVFIASVMKGDENTFPEINFCGNILNIYDLSDTSFVSGIKRKETSKLKISRYQDIAINTGLSHGFLFKAMKEWIDPTALWAYRKYDEIHE